MREMKDSGIEWVGEIPENWDTAKIKNLFLMISGATPIAETEFWDGDIIWVTPADYKTKDKYIVSGKRNLTNAGYNSCSTTLVPKGSLIFSKRAPIGTVAIAATPLCTNQGCISCAPTGKVFSEFYYYVFSVCTEHFELLGTGTTFKEISASNFANCAVPFPLADEQHRIASYLDAKCAEIDALTADIQTQIDTLEQYDGFAGAIGISDSRGKASPVLNVLDTEQSKRYIMYFLRSMAYSDVFLALATGIRVRSCDLRWNKLSELFYPVPPLEEQEAIVDYIDSVLRRTDEVITAKREQLSTLEAYKKSLIYEYVTGKKEVPHEG